MNPQEQQQNQDQERDQRTPTRNAVRGPTSALTSFLREQGIRVTNRNQVQRRQRREEELRLQRQGEVAAAVGSSSSTTSSPGSQGDDRIDRTDQSDSSAATATLQTADEQQGSTNLLYMPRRSTARSSAASSVIAQASSSSKAKKKRKKGDSDYEDGSSSDTEGDASSSWRATARLPRTKIVFCEKCKGRFSRPLHENHDIEQENQCPACRDGGDGPKARKVKGRGKRQRNMGAFSGESQAQVPSLQDICVNVLVKFIDNVEEFGDIGSDNLDKIAKIICRHRKMNTQTVRLFLNPMARKLTLYDCANIDHIALTNVAHFCFNLTDIKLVYCGQMTSAVLETYAEHLHQLRSIDLSGPYLVQEESWIKFIKTVGKRLEKFVLRHCFRFTKACLVALADHCPDLQYLELAHINTLDDDWLAVIERFKKLKTLRLEWPDEKRSLSAESLVALLSKIGANLTELTLPGCTEVDDRVLTEGILEYCPKLKVLDLAECNEISSEGIHKLFTGWSKQSHNDGLEVLNIARCLSVDDRALRAILVHSAKTLTSLNLHSLDLLTASGLEMIAGRYGQENGEQEKSKDPSGKKAAVACKQLKRLDCSFVRAMDDFVLKHLSNACGDMQELNVWGCYQLTNQVTLPAKLRVYGREMVV